MKRTIKRFTKPLGIIGLIILIVTVTCVTVSAIASCLPAQNTNTLYEQQETVITDTDITKAKPYDDLSCGSAFTEADTEVDPDTDTEIDTEADNEFDTETDTETDSEFDTETDTEACDMFTKEDNSAANYCKASETMLADNDSACFAEEPQNSNTYIKISISQQHLWLYENGNLLLDTPIVTGNNDGKCNTPSGVYCIQSLEKNLTLVGDDYEAFVDYWMGFNDNIGIHDADWRDDFGGDIYQGDGSHGCVNVPCDAAEIIYNHINYGTPVYID